MTIQMLPLNQLTPSKANVRKTGALSGIEELAASIEAHGLLQNLQVRVCAKGKFEVVAGGRRLAAMNILRRQKKLAKDFPVPCHIIEDGDASEISLAENVVRLAMHPADQFVAFNGLAAQGLGIEDIAARFGVSVAVVRQRLKLASVSAVLIGVYREGDMTLDQLMAFTVSDDHDAQEAAWFDQPAYQRDPHHIRATLTEAQVECDDHRVLFVGVEAYLAAGGGMNRDLFQPEHEGYLTDRALLDRLVAERLNTAAAEIRGEGWAWVEVGTLASFGGYGRVRSTREPLAAEQSERLEKLTAEYDGLVSTYGEDPEEDIAQSMQSIWAEIEAIEATSYHWKTEDIARAGVVLSLDYNGSLMVERGLVRPEDGRAASPRDHEIGDGEQVMRPTSQSDGLSAALTQSLTAERTAALRAMVMDNQPVALASLCFALALPVFYPFVSGDRSAMQLRLTRRDLASSGDYIANSRAGVLLAERQAAWEAQLPESPDELFGWLLTQDGETISALLAHCAAQSIDAVRVQREWANAPRHVHADAIAYALHLDMRDWWTASRENYLARVPKTLVLDAVREGVSAQAAENLAMLKKDRLGEAAERRLAGTGWLPALFRAPVIADAETETDYQKAA